jgi:ribosome-binding protein aMBF1 (putative translation factor)
MTSGVITVCPTCAHDGNTECALGLDPGSCPRNKTTEPPAQEQTPEQAPTVAPAPADTSEDTSHIAEVFERIVMEDRIMTLRHTNALLRQALACAYCPICGEVIGDAGWRISEDDDEYLIHEGCAT